MQILAICINMCNMLAWSCEVQALGSEMLVPGSDMLAKCSQMLATLHQYPGKVLPYAMLRASSCTKSLRALCRHM